MSKNNIAQFPHLSEICDGKEINQELKSDIAVHLDILKNEFVKYFPELDVNSMETQMVHNPFICTVDDIRSDLQDQLIDLAHDSSAKDAFDHLDLIEFWCKMQPAYPAVGSVALRTLILFMSTYLCEQAFSQMLLIKSKTRNKLLNLEADL